MSYSHYDRLTALDASFLRIEDASVHMHVGSIGLFESAPLQGPHGALDMERIMAVADHALARHPRFRQKLAWVPLLGDPVWVDDASFNLHYHVRHTALPPPGDIRQLKRLFGRIMSQQLDRGKPLWELWFVEGIAGGRFAVISKIHHCMIDGVSGVELLAGFMGPDPDHIATAPEQWVPRPQPSPLHLLSDDVARRATLPVDILRAGGELIRQPRRSVKAAGEALEGVAAALRASLAPATPSPLNCDIGPHRRFDWLRLDLDRLKDIKNRLGGTLNDVVLAIVAGAMRRFLRHRGEQVDDLDFRVMVPVNVRTAAQHEHLGNKVSFLMAPLPVRERDAGRRLKQVSETMQRLKHSQQGRGAELLEEFSDRAFSSMFAMLARLGARSLSYNMVVTNVPGPPFPVYLQGARLQEIYPLVPLFNRQALGIALFSYDGGLFWGLNADWDAVPDLHMAVEAIEKEFRQLSQIATATPLPIQATPVQPRSSVRPAQKAVRRRGRDAAPTARVGRSARRRRTRGRAQQS